MSSIILPMEICRVPSDLRGRQDEARRVKLSMLVTAKSTSARNWGSCATHSALCRGNRKEAESQGREGPGESGLR